MGTACVRENAISTQSQLPIYEQLCSGMEDELRLSSITIEKFEEALNIECYCLTEVGLDVIGKVYEKFGISKETFNDPLAPYNKFYSEIAVRGDIRRSILLGVLPICPGKIENKKLILWACLDLEKENCINVKALKTAIKKIIKISTKVVPSMVISRPKHKLGSSDGDLETLMNQGEIAVEEYAAAYDIGLDLEKIKKEKYDNWFEEIDGDKLFSSVKHRAHFLKHLKSVHSKQNKEINS